MNNENIQNPYAGQPDQAARFFDLIEAGLSTESAQAITGLHPLAVALRSEEHYQELRDIAEIHRTGELPEHVRRELEAEGYDLSN
jgi:hypothetical protein